MSSVQGLARKGIINFDPDAYIKEGIAEYMEQDDAYLPFDRPLYSTPYVGYRAPMMRPEQPHHDVYVRHEKHSSSWGPAIIGAAVGALATYLGYELFKDKEKSVVNPIETKPEIKPEAKPEVKSEAKSDVKPEAKSTVEKAKEGTKGFFTDLKDLAGETKDKVVGWFKGKKVESEIDKVVNDAARNPASVQKGYFKTRFYKTKIALGIAAAATALYIVYNWFAGKSHDSAQSHGGGH